MSSRRNLQRYAEQDLDQLDDEYDYRDRFDQTIRNGTSSSNGNNIFGVSVIRHKPSRNNVVEEDEEFNNMLHAMDINRRSHGHENSSEYSRTIRKSKSNSRIPKFVNSQGQGLPRSHSMKLRGNVGDLSIVQEGFSEDEEMNQQTYEPDNEFITLTKDNIKKINEYHNSKINPRLAKYIDSNEYNNGNFEDEDDFENDFEIDEKINSTLKLTKQLPRSRSFNSKGSLNYQNEKNNDHNKISQFANVPLPSSTVTSKQLRLPTSQSMRSLSSFTSSSNGSSSAKSIDAYSEDSGTEESDYADDYELEIDEGTLEDMDQGPKSNFDYLLKKFEQRQQQAEEKANLEKKLIQQKSQTFQRRYQNAQSNQNNVVEYDHSIMEDDFDDFEELDNLKLQRFINKNNLRNPDFLSNYKSQPHLNKKISMPNGFTINQYGSNDQFQKAGPSKRNLRKASSTLELSSSHSLHPDPFKASVRPTESATTTQTLRRQQQRVYNGNELDDVDMELDSNDITITMADLKMLHQKRLIDLSKYAEQPSTRSKKSTMTISRGLGNGNHNTITERLNKEGKIKMIKNLAKSKMRQSLPGHKYGDMVYDPHSMKWFGNEDELTKFEMINKPALIQSSSVQNSNFTKRQALNKRASTLNLEGSRLEKNVNQTVKKRVATLMEMPNPQIVDDMIYDPEKLRWISISGKYEDDPFDNMGINDSTILMEDGKYNLPPPHQKTTSSQTPMMALPGQRSPTRGENLVSRAISQPSSPQKKTSDGLPLTEEFLQISREQYKQWKNEEARWQRKVGNWFPNNDDSFKFCYDLKLFLNDNN